MRRWRKTPESVIEEYRSLLRVLDLSVNKCAEIAGIRSHPLVLRVAREERRYISRWRWVVIATGEIRPVANPCPIACAARKTKLSEKTIRRRVWAGMLTAEKSPSDGRLLFDASELGSVSVLTTGPKGKLSEADVLNIRRRAASGETHHSIAADYPVTRRQVSRIVSGQRWQRIEGI